MMPTVSGGSGEVLLIGVSYDSDDMALRFAASACRQTGSKGCAVMIVDNTERDRDQGLAARLRAFDSDITYVDAPSNLGYFGGADHGLKHYLEHHPLPEWVVVSNVDVEFRDHGFLRNLHSTIRPDDIAALAPSILSNVTLGDLNPFMARRPRKITVRFRKVVFSNVYTLNAYEFGSAMKSGIIRTLRRSLGSRDIRRGRPGQAIYAPHGSCIVFARRYFERGGGLKYPLFMYGEEVFVAETARQLELRIVYDPSLRVRHDEHSSTGLPRSRGIASCIGEAQAYIADQYFR